MKSISLFVLMLGLPFIFYSCRSEGYRRILVDDVIAEGNISEDTVYNGIINFYDTLDNRLISTARFQNGTLDGETIQYYPSGEPKVRLTYENGKVHGEMVFFDSLGNFSNKQNLFYDIRVGESATYKNNQIDQYYFYSLENRELLHINYDSVQVKSIQQLTDTSFFFWHLNHFTVSGAAELNAELFLYLPNPPGLNFKYSLCIIDSTSAIKEIVEEFAPTTAWVKTSLHQLDLRTKEIYAIRLSIDNEFDNDDRVAIMLKKLSMSDKKTQ